MKLEEFKNYELTEENVLLLYSRCLATEQSKSKLTVKVYYPHLCGQDSPEVTFDEKKLALNAAITYHMLGQLKAVHDKQPFMASKQGLTNYKGEKWTTKSSTLFALYALGIAMSLITPFVKHNNMNFSVTDIRAIEPRYQRDDPNYAQQPSKS